MFHGEDNLRRETLLAPLQQRVHRTAVQRYILHILCSLSRLKAHKHNVAFLHEAWAAIVSNRR